MSKALPFSIASIPEQVEADHWDRISQEIATLELAATTEITPDLITTTERSSLTEEDGLAFLRSFTESCRTRANGLLDEMAASSKSMLPQPQAFKR